MRNITKTVFFYSELSDTAKAKARDWFREASASDDDYSEFVLEDAATIADLFGLDIRNRVVKLMDGTTRGEPSAYWSGFSSQGDGACFEGTYKYRKGSFKAVQKHAPQDHVLHAIVLRLAIAQRMAFYKLEAKITNDGRYSHSQSMEIDVFPNDDQYNSLDDDNEIEEALRAFADWIYRQLESSYEYSNSDETVADNIEANEYEFDEHGNRA